LHLLCGLIASGKSTLAQQLASRPLTVLISEDAWLAQHALRGCLARRRSVVSVVFSMARLFGFYQRQAGHTGLKNCVAWPG
jgi:predicted kinase